MNRGSKKSEHIANKMRLTINNISGTLAALPPKLLSGELHPPAKGN
jgi:hypothetical protein